MKFLVKTYDRIAPYYSKRNYNHFWKIEFPIFKKLVKGRKVVDIGCGAGRDAVQFLKNKFDYTGIDISKGMLKEAKKRAPRGKFKVMSFYKISLPKESFDGFWASASLLHIPKEKLSKVLKSMRALLKPNGVGFISVQKRKGVSEVISIKDAYNGQVKNVKRFFAYYTKNEMKKVLENNGFKVVNFTTRFQKDPGLTWLCFFVRKV